MSTSPPRFCFMAGEIFGLTAVGGGERQAALLRKALTSRGVGVDVVTRRMESAGAVPDAQRVFYYDGKPGFRLDWIPSIIEAASQSDADVFYDRGMSVLTIAVGRVARRKRAGFIWAGSSDMDADSPLRRLRRAYLEGRSATGGASPIRAAARAVVGAYIHARALSAARGADVVIAQTDGQARLLRATLGPRMPIEVLPSLPPQTAPGEAVRDTILWVGGNKPVKRPGAFLQVARRGPAGLRYEMVGKGFPTAFAGDAPVEVLDALSHERLQSEYARSLALVSTSDVEGFPNTFLEAWNAGTPVLSLGLDPGGVIERFGLGWVCGDVDDAARELTEQASSTYDAAAIASRCRAYVAEHHSGEDVIDRLVEIASGLSSPAGGGRG